MRGSTRTQALGALVVVAMAAVSGCVGSPNLPDTVLVATDLTVRRLADGVWLHATGDDARGEVASNGLFIETRHGVVLVDPGLNAKLTEQLMAWTQLRLNKPVTHAIVTHGHAARLEGVRPLFERKIPIYAHESTARALTTAGLAGPYKTFREAITLKFGRRQRVELLFPGAGQTNDSIVVWSPRGRVLFGSTLVTSPAVAGLGTIQDSSLPAWAATVQRLEQKFSRANYVIPSHGAWGGRELLVHTRELLQTRVAQVRE